MNFKLPFPTLKLLNMVQLGKRILDELRSFNKMWIPSKVHKQRYVVDKITKLLPIGPALRHDFTDVLEGMHYQLVDHLIDKGLREFWNLEKLEFLFDVHGKLDCPTIWKRYIHSQVSDPYSLAFDSDPLNSLVKLLQFAIDQSSWHGIHAILSKISTFYSLNPDGAWLESGKLVFVHGKYAMFYRLSNSLTSRTASHVRSRFQRLFRNSTSIEVRQKGLYLYGVHFDRLFFQDYFKDAQNSMDLEEQFAFLRNTIFDKYRSRPNMRCAIDILGTLDQETAHRCFVAILEMNIVNKDMFFCCLLHRCTKWPLTHLLQPLLKYAEPYLTPTTCEFHFNDIVSFFIPERGFFGVHYAEVLEKFWDAIPSHAKEYLRSGSGVVIRFGDNEIDFKNSLKLLSKNNTYLFDKISTELWPEKSLCE